MNSRVFLVAVLLCLCAGGASADSAPVKIQAFAGESVILPCRFNVSDDLPTVEWSKEGLDGNFAFLYRDGCETHEMKNPVFWYRTNLILNELTKGNFSLRISSVQLSDAGRYRCKTIRRKIQKVVTMELFVAAVSEPTLSVVPAVDGGVTLQCEAKCWFPEPEVTFLDDHGNTISAENPKIHPDSRGCFSVTRRLNVQTNTNRTVCRVHQPETNQTRVTESHIPDCCLRSCALPTSMAVIGTIILCAAVVFGYKCCGSSVEGQKCPVTRQSWARSTSSSKAECYAQRNQADNIGNAITELLKKMDELRMSPHDKEEVIRQLTERLNNHRYKQSPVVCQPGRPTTNKSLPKSSPDVSKPLILPSHQSLHGNNPKPAASTNSHCPKSDNLGQSKGPLIEISSQNHSSPALLSDNGAVPPSSPSACTSEQNHVVRSMSLSESRSRTNNGKPQRRYTISALSSNRFGPLANLTEDSEPLL